MNKSNDQRSWEMIAHHLGRLADYMGDPNCKEIMANPDGSVFVDTLAEGRRAVHPGLSTLARRAIIELMASSEGTICTSESPTISGTVPVVGGRFQGFLPPACRPGPCFCIRRIAGEIPALGDYIGDGGLSYEDGYMLSSAALAKKNFLIVGGTGSGKTTFINAMLRGLGRFDDRLVVIEDEPELVTPSRNVVRLSASRHQGMTFQEAVFKSLRMSPDRIILGELRDGKSALALLKAWNTGHRGGFTTVHANSARLALARLEDLLLEVDFRSPQRLISQAIDVIVFLEMKSTGKGGRAPVVSEIVELASNIKPNGDYKFKELSKNNKGEQESNQLEQTRLLPSKEPIKPPLI